MARLAAFVVMLSSLLLSSCGFHLRGDLPLSQFEAMHIKSERHSELAALVAQRLQHNKVQLLDSYQQTAPVLQLIDDSLERRNLTLFPNGQVAEYELIYSVTYVLHQADGSRLAPRSVEVYRDYQDDPNFALAKTREREVLLGEMREDAARALLRQVIATLAE